LASSQRYKSFWLSRIVSEERYCANSQKLGGKSETRKISHKKYFLCHFWWELPQFWACDILINSITRSFLTSLSFVMEATDKN